MLLHPAPSKAILVDPRHPATPSLIERGNRIRSSPTSRVAKFAQTGCRLKLSTWRCKQSCPCALIKNRPPANLLYCLAWQTLGMLCEALVTDCQLRRGSFAKAFTSSFVLSGQAKG